MRLGKTLALLSSVVAFGCGSAGSDTREPSGSPPPEGEEVAGEQCEHGGAMGGHGMRHASAMGGHGMRHASAMGGHGMGHGSAMGGHGMHHASAMGGHGMRHGSAMGGHGVRGGGRGPSQDQRDDFHGLLADHQKIERHVEQTEDGVVTTTTSTDPEVAEVLRRHARSMHEHFADGGIVHPWDPIFAALAEHSGEVELSFEDIPGGVRVTGRGTTPEAVALVRAHAEVVSAFVANGHEEAHREHPVPETAE